jgi:hypothetical protein
MLAKNLLYTQTDAVRLGRKKRNTSLLINVRVYTRSSAPRSKMLLSCIISLECASVRSILLGFVISRLRLVRLSSLVLVRMGYKRHPVAVYARSHGFLIP